MKNKKTSVVGTLQIISILLILFQCVALFFYNKPIFYIGIVIASVIAVASLLAYRRLRHRVHKAVLNGANILAGNDAELIDKFATPVAVFSKNNKILWANKAFSNEVMALEEILNETASKLFDSETYEALLDNGFSEAAVGNKIFRVVSIIGQENNLFYFIDQTALKRITAQYKFSRPVAAVLQIDALDEILKNEKEAKKAQIRSTLQSVIENWFSSANGIMYPFSNDRYLLIFEYRHLKRFEEEQFSILEEIRNRDFEGYKSITVSLGIGYGATDLHECELIARASLDLALGRGGDQAVIRKKDSDYKFYGGVKAGNERASKVRARVTAKSVYELMKNNRRVVVMGHRFADLDSLGAAFALVHLADTLGTQAHLVVENGGDMASSLLGYIKEKGYSEFLSEEKDILGEIDGETLVIVVDTHRPDFVSSKAILEKAEKIVVIDHHRTAGNHIKNAIIFYNETVTSSACELVTEILQYCGENVINPDVANALMAGIMLDTKNFVLNTGVRTYEAAAYLRRRGSEPVTVKGLFADSMSVYKAKHEVISAAYEYRNCAIAVNTQKNHEARLVSAQAADELMGVNNVKASFVLFEADEKICISARSYGEINVQRIMEEMGGGGHRTMAATTLSDMDLQSAQELLKQNIDNFLNR